MRKILLIASVFIGGYLLGKIPERKAFNKLKEIHKNDVVELNNTKAKLGKTEEMLQDYENLRDMCNITNRLAEFVNKHTTNVCKKNDELKRIIQEMKYEAERLNR